MMRRQSDVKNGEEKEMYSSAIEGRMKVLTLGGGSFSLLNSAETNIKWRCCSFNLPATVDNKAGNGHITTAAEIEARE
ncbi:hypothetical protein ACS0TY_015031 [Phlomoides rotata]